MRKAEHDMFDTLASYRPTDTMIDAEWTLLQRDQTREQILSQSPNSPVLPRALLVSGRRRHRRRIVTRVLVSAAAVGAVATGLTVALDDIAPASAQERFLAAAPAPAYETYGAFASGRTVYIGNHQVTFDEEIKALYYTSEGVLVRRGRVAHTNDPGPSHYTLIHSDGSFKTIVLPMKGRIMGTDPDSPNVAYAQPTGNRWSFVVTNLSTGKDVARKTVDGTFTWGGWDAPPVTLSGGRMWALFDNGWMEFDWRNGSTRMVPGTAGDALYMAHGRYAEFDEENQTSWTIKDFITGAVLRRIPVSQSTIGTLSPDGRFVRLIDEMDVGGTPSPKPSRLVSIDTGKEVSLLGGAVYGWTPGGNTLEVDATRDRLTVCYPATGDCDHITLEVGPGDIKLGGLAYES